MKHTTIASPTRKRSQFLSGSHATPYAISVETCSTVRNIFFGFDGDSLLAFGHQLTHLLPRSCSDTIRVLHTRLIHWWRRRHWRRHRRSSTLKLFSGMRERWYVLCGHSMHARASVCRDYYCCYSLLLLLLPRLLLHPHSLVRSPRMRLANVFVAAAAAVADAAPLSVCINGLFSLVSRLPLGMLCASVWHHDASLCRGYHSVTCECSNAKHTIHLSASFFWTIEYFSVPFYFFIFLCGEHGILLRIASVWGGPCVCIS